MKPHFTNTGNPIDFPKTEKMMNERIKELAEQQGLTGPNYLISLQELEKFAELIVKECASIVADAVDHREPASTYVGKIKQHFGVEE